MNLLFFSIFTIELDIKIKVTHEKSSLRTELFMPLMQLHLSKPWPPVVLVTACLSDKSTYIFVQIFRFQKSCASWFFAPYHPSMVLFFIRYLKTSFQRFSTKDLGDLLAHNQLSGKSTLSPSLKSGSFLLLVSSILVAASLLVILWTSTPFSRWTFFLQTQRTWRIFAVDESFQVEGHCFSIRHIIPANVAPYRLIRHQVRYKSEWSWKCRHRRQVVSFSVNA